MKTKVLMVSAKRQGGKDTTGNFLLNNAKEIFPKGFVVKKYGFGDELKKTCSELFNFDLSLCYTEVGKNTQLQHILWENLPYHDNSFPTGPMTVRALLQEFGTGIVRCINDNAWRDKCVSSIRKDKPNLAVIIDFRFPGEDLSIYPEFEVKKIRLTRDINDPKDPASNHISETALDNFDKFDATIANHTLTENQANQTCLGILKGFGWIN